MYFSTEIKNSRNDTIKLKVKTNIKKKKDKDNVFIDKLNQSMS